MKNIDKLIEQFSARKRNIRFREIEKVLLQVGFVERKSKKSTSHFVFSHPRLIYNITLVSHGKSDYIPTYQVNDVIRALKELKNL